MKNTLTLFLLIFTVFSSNVEAQNNSVQDSQKTYSDTQIHAFVNEVFGESADALVFQNSERFKMIKRFLETVEISNRTDIPLDKAFPTTNDLALNNKYNANLQYDTSVSNIAIFNPLKYKLEQFPLKPLMYRIAKTSYFISITPKN